MTAISQVLWGSIGYAVGALQGAALACNESFPHRRVILFVGDGSLQLTVQEISTMIRHGLKPIMQPPHPDIFRVPRLTSSRFVINNKGYTIERMIHGADAVYNDIQPWNHTALLNVFGADPEKSASYHMSSRAALDSLFNDEKFSGAPHIQLVEVFMPKMDAPRALFKVGEMTAKLNSNLKSGA